MAKKTYLAPKVTIENLLQDVLMFSNYDNVGGDEEWNIQVKGEQKMKSLTKRNLLLVVLSLIVALCSLTFAATVKPARAEDVTPITVGTLEVMEEASIRIGKDADTGVVGGAQSGIRFRARIDADTYAALTAENSPAYMGFLITPKQLYNDRAAAEDESYGKDDYINSISNYVGDQGTGIKVTKGFYEEDGYYYANAAVNNMFEKNIELEFTAVAYIWDGAEYHYSAPSADFGRTYKQVVTKAFIDGHNPEHLKLAAYVGDTAEGQEDGFVSTLVNGAPITIDNSNDLYNLSNAVANGVDSFENSNFVLAGNMEVDHDFIAIDPTKVGGITANEGTTVQVYNNKGLEDSILAEGTIDNLTVKNETKLFNASSRAGDLVEGYYYPELVSVNGCMTATEISEEVADLKNPVNYTDNAVSVSVSGEKMLGVLVKPNYTKTDLQGMDEINSVRFSLMVSAEMVSNCSKNLKFTTSLIGLCGYDAAEARDIARSTVKNNKAPAKQWRTVTVSKEEFLQAYNTEDTIAVYGKHNTESSGEIYIGDIELLEEITLFGSYKKIKDVFASYTPVEKDAEGTVISTATATAIYNATSDRAFSVVKPESASTTVWSKEVIEGEIPSILMYKYVFPNLVSFNSNSGALSTFNKKFLYAKLNYDKAEILALAGTRTEENDVVSYSNFNGVAITYCVDSLDGNGITELYKGALSFGKENANKWITVTYSIDDFIEYLGFNSFELESVTYSTADLINTDDYLFLGYVGHSSSKTTKIRMHLAGIEFVKELPAA